MQQEYTATVKKLEKHVFHSNQETTDDQLNRVGKKIFKKEWGGVYAEDDKLPLQYPYKYFIVNTDKANQEGTHWTAVYADIQHKRIYIYDTFNRQLSKLLHDVEVNAHEKHFTVKKGSHKIHQKESQNDCGQRSMAWLMLVKKHGIVAEIKKL